MSIYEKDLESMRDKMKKIYMLALAFMVLFSMTMSVCAGTKNNK